jgi:uncharacterized membrane protein YciS (DUF1049 family)
MAEKIELNSDVEGRENRAFGFPDGKEALPPYTGQAAYAGQSPYAGQPAYAGQPPYAGQQYYPGQPPYAGSAYPAAQYGQQSQQSTSNVVVTQPQYAPGTVVATTIPDNMGLAVFACLCCFWPLGLFAICRASESQNAMARGDIQGAAKNARDARVFSLISIGIGIALIIVIIIIAVAVPIASYNSRVNSYDYGYSRNN